MSLKSQISNRESPTGFTLLELLVVVTIIVILIAILVPSLDRAVEATMRAKCAANLDAIHVATMQYAQSNNGSIFICRGRLVQIAFNPLGTVNGYGNETDGRVDWPSALGSVGLASSQKEPQFNNAAVVQNTPSKLWDCPSRDFQSFWDGGGQLVIGYQYLGGLEFWHNPHFGARRAISPKGANSSRGDLPLVVDSTFRGYQQWGNDYNGYPQYYRNNPAHQLGESKKPTGANQVYMDGSAEWVGADRLVNIHDWGATFDHQYFWYQRDLGGWDPPDAAYASNLE